MKTKKNNKKIIILLLLLGIFVIATSTVSAAITAENGGTTTVPTTGQTILADIIGFFSTIGNITLTGIGAFITPLINLLSGLLFLLIQALFSLTSAESAYASPWPDWVVFNKVPLLDANFINPHQDSLINRMGQDIFIDLFASMRVIAQTLFIIAAMITGLKLATTTIAAKKAQYKEALTKWVMGFIILFSLKWILAGIFYINELLVSAIATSAFGTRFGVKALNFVPIIGAVINFVSELLFNTTPQFWADGFWGMVMMLYAEAAGGNIIASIATFVILGQTFVVLGSYFKRLFVCIMLGVLSPMVVAVDTIIGITGGKSTVFKSWLKNFIFTVFTQSFHAAYMAVALSIISKIWGTETQFKGKYMETLVTITLITGLVKLEKTLKGLFGMGDSMAGALSDGSKGMKKAMQAAAGLAAAGRAIGDNAGKLKDARARKSAINNEQARLKQELADQKSGNKLPSAQTVVNSNVNNNVDSSGSGSGKEKEKDYLQSVLEKERKQPKTIEEKLQVLGEAEAKARADEKSALFASAMSIPNLAAGIGVGLGMGDDIGETLFKGGLVTAALDKSAEKIGYKAADRDRKSLAQREKRDGEEYGYTPSSNIRRDGRAADATIRADIAFDIKKLGHELNKQFKDVGYTFTDQVKKELKQIDKDLDNEKGG